MVRGNTDEYWKVVVWVGISRGGSSVCMFHAVRRRGKAVGGVVGPEEGRLDDLEWCGYQVDGGLGRGRLIEER